MYILLYVTFYLFVLLIFYYYIGFVFALYLLIFYEFVSFKLVFLGKYVVHLSFLFELCDKFIDRIISLYNFLMVTSALMSSTRTNGFRHFVINPLFLFFFLKLEDLFVYFYKFAIFFCFIKLPFPTMLNLANRNIL